MREKETNMIGSSDKAESSIDTKHKKIFINFYYRRETGQVIETAGEWLEESWSKKQTNVEVWKRHMEDFFVKIPLEYYNHMNTKIQEKVTKLEDNFLDYLSLVDGNDPYLLGKKDTLKEMITDSQIETFKVKAQEQNRSYFEKSSESLKDLLEEFIDIKSEKTLTDVHYKRYRLQVIEDTAEWIEEPWEEE